jgi:hypothetical protein
MLSQPPPPPHITHSTHRLTHAEAHAFLTTFLQTSTTDPSYRPDATLSSRGPISSSAGPSAPLPLSPSDSPEASLGESNLTLANLRRIALGLSGVRVGGARFTSTSTSQANKKRKRNGNDDQGEGEGEGWEDKETYEQAQSEIEEDEFEIQQPQLGAGNGEEVGVEENVEVVRETRPGDEDEDLEGMIAGREEQGGAADGVVVDKAERKRLKKVREKEKKRLRESARRTGGDVA